MPTIDEEIAQTLAYLNPPPSFQEQVGIPADFDVVGQAQRALAAMQPPVPQAPAVVGNDRLQYPGIATGQAGTVVPENPSGPNTEYPVSVDRLEAERGDPDLSEVEGYDPDANTYRSPAPVGSVEAGTSAYVDQTSKVAGAAERAGMAKLDAEAARAARTAGAMEAGAEKQLEIANHYQTQREMANAQADTETAKWLGDLQNLARQEPNPSRYWENRGGLSKALWLIGMVAGAAHVAITPGAKNSALEMFRQEVQNDIDSQKARLASEIAVAKLKGQKLNEKQLRNLSDLKDDHTMAMTRVQALERAWLARAVAPGDEDKQAAKMAAMQFFEQELKLPLIEKMRAEKIAEKQAEIARREARAMAAAQRAFTAQQNRMDREFRAGESALDRQLRRDLAEVELSAKKGTPGIGPDGLPVLRQVQSGPGAATGLVVKGPDGKLANGDGILRVRDDKQMAEATEVSEKANRRYAAMLKLRTILEDEGSMVEVFGVGVVNPQLQATVNQLGYEIAKEHDPRITNQDFSKGVSQAMGFDPNGSWLERGKFALSREEILKKIEEDLNAMPKHVSNSMNKYNDASIMGQGTSVVWEPQNLRGEEARVPKAADIEGRRGPNTVENPVKDVKDYEKRVQEDAASLSGVKSVPDHDASAVQAVINTAVGHGPATIKAKAAETLKQLDARAERLRAAGDAEGLTKVENTKAIIETVTADASKRAAKTLDDFKRHMDGLRETAKQQGWKWQPTKDTARSVAKKKGIGGATEVEDYIRKTYPE